jgi:hypothetical protein
VSKVRLAACETPPVHAAAATGIGFLLSVLWFDLMFDVQVRAHREPVLPAEVRDSIAAYYRRVTTAARPMNRLIALVMLVTLVALVGEIAGDDVPTWVAWTSLVLAGSAIGLAGARTVRNAVRLGAQVDDGAGQSVLARSIFRDHVACLLAIGATLLLQVLAA